MYSDLILAACKLRKASGGRVQKVMIIDLDVHQVSCAPAATPHSRCSSCCPAAECLQCSVSTHNMAASGTAQWALASAQFGEPSLVQVHNRPTTCCQRCAPSLAGCTCWANHGHGSAVAVAFQDKPAETALLSASSCRDAVLSLQGNGLERDKLHFQDTDLHILDIYNCDLWPGDKVAQKAIDTEVALTSGTCDDGAAAGRH